MQVMSLEIPFTAGYLDGEIGSRYNPIKEKCFIFIRAGKCADRALFKEGAWKENIGGYKKQ